MSEEITAIHVKSQLKLASAIARNFSQNVMITFVNVFTVLPEKQQDALNAARVYQQAVKHQPGFISAKLLKSDDGTRVTAIAQWESKQHLQAMRATPEFKNLQDRHFYEAIVSNDGHVYNTAVEIESSQ